MHEWNRRVIGWSRSGWSILAAFAALFVSFQLLFVFGERFAAVTADYQPFDLQNPLSLDQVRQQLPYYTAESRSIYALFIAADMVFPFCAALFLSLVLARALHTIGNAWAGRWQLSGVVLLPLGLAVLDWVENVFFALTVWLYPFDVTLWAAFAIGLKTVKILAGIIVQLVVTVLAIYAGSRWLRRRWQAGVRATQGTK